MATLSTLSLRTYAKPNYAASTLPHLHLAAQIRCSCKSTFLEIGIVFAENADSIMYAATRDEMVPQFKELRNVACGILAVWAVTAVSPVIAASQVYFSTTPFLLPSVDSLV